VASSTAAVRPEDIIRRIGDTNERALAYVLEPDPQLSRMGRKVRENILADLPPVTAGALLGPDALARHFIASAASGRYRDLFALWDLFRARPSECRPVLAERQKALEKGRAALATAVRLGLGGHAERVAEDVTRASGLIWTWMREALVAEAARIGARPAVASALLVRDPGFEVTLPDAPDDRWLAEAAAARRTGPLAAPVEAVLRANADRLPATIETLALAQEHYPERVPTLVGRIDLASDSIGALLAWARDHGHAHAVLARVRVAVEASAEGGRAQGVATWWSWRERGIDVELPAVLRAPDLGELDVSRPDVAALIAVLVADGAAIDPQALVEQVAGENRQRGEKAYEAFVCAGLDVTLPATLLGNPLVKEGTRCPFCQSWTYVRAGHERRCPRRPAGADLPPAAAEPAAPAAAPDAAATPADDFAAAFDAAMAEELSAAEAEAVAAVAQPAETAPPVGTPATAEPAAPVGTPATAEPAAPVGTPATAEPAAAPAEAVAPVEPAAAPVEDAVDARPGPSTAVDTPLAVPHEPDAVEVAPVGAEVPADVPLAAVETEPVATAPDAPEHADDRPADAETAVPVGFDIPAQASAEAEAASDSAPAADDDQGLEGDAAPPSDDAARGSATPPGADAARVVPATPDVSVEAGDAGEAADEPAIFAPPGTDQGAAPGGTEDDPEAR